MDFKSYPIVALTPTSHFKAGVSHRAISAYYSNQTYRRAMMRMDLFGGVMLQAWGPYFFREMLYWMDLVPEHYPAGIKTPGQNLFQTIVARRPGLVLSYTAPTLAEEAFTEALHILRRNAMDHAPGFRASRFAHIVDFNSLTSIPLDEVEEEAAELKKTILEP